MRNVPRLVSTFAAALALAAVTGGCVIHPPGHWRRQWRADDRGDGHHHHRDRWDGWRDDGRWR